VDVSEELRRRVRVAAAHEDVTIQEYVVRSLEERLNARSAVQAAEASDRADMLIEHLLGVRRRIFGDQMLDEDSVDILRAARDRDHS
jgi:hypothetical protein